MWMLAYRIFAGVRHLQLMSASVTPLLNIPGNVPMRVDCRLNGELKTCVVSLPERNFHLLGHLLVSNSWNHEIKSGSSSPIPWSVQITSSTGDIHVLFHGTQRPN